VNSIITLEKTDSTNNYIKQNFNLLENFTIVRAIQQTAGRGRRSNKWYSLTQKDLTFSMLYYIPQQIQNFNNLTIFIGVALHRALSKYILTVNNNIKKLRLKWPNDILYDKKKIAGILCESIVKGENAYAIIGVGINVNSMNFHDEIKESTTSLKQIFKNIINIDELMNKVSQEIKLILSDLNERIPTNIIKEYENACGCIDRELVIENVHKGIIQQLNTDGSIQVLNNQNELENIIFY